MPLDDVKFLFGELVRFFQNAVGNLGLTNIMEKTACSSLHNFFFTHAQPACKNIADQCYIHAVHIGLVIIFPHTVQHVENIRGGRSKVENIQGMVHQFIDIQRRSLFYDVIHCATEGIHVIFKFFVESGKFGTAPEPVCIGGGVIIRLCRLYYKLIFYV